MAGLAKQEWARLGALARLQQIDEERESILKAFPDLRSKKAPALSAGRRPRRTLSAAMKRKMSVGMRKYWAKRKAQQKSA